MLGAFDAAVRPPSPMRSAARTLAVVLAVAVTGLVAGSTSAQAAEAQSGSVEVDGLALTLDLACTVICAADVTGMSSGSISGVDGTSPFTVEWTGTPGGATNLAGTVYYSAGCSGPVWDGATMTGASFVHITGATLTYGSGANVTRETATVTLYFSGDIEPGLFVPFTQDVVVASASHSIDIAFDGIPGSLATVPNTAPGLCGGWQTYTASGIFLTLA